MVTHTNLLANLTMMQQCLVYRGEDEIDNGCVCWLPLYHDMGLVGCLYLGMYYPGTVTIHGTGYVPGAARYLAAHFIAL